MKKLVVRTFLREKVPAELIEQMWRLYSESYEGVARERFDADLAPKTHVFIAFDRRSGDFKGFSTAQFYLHEFQFKHVGVVYSGDTMIDKEYWGQKALHQEFVRQAFRWKLTHPGTPLYWYLIASGYRTYLTMARNFPEYWPRHERATPPWQRGLIHSISAAKFGDAWKAERGVIELGEKEVTLAAGLAPFTGDVLKLPEIEFFTRANPDYHRGVELACIGNMNLAFLGFVLSKWVKPKTRRVRA